MGWGLCKGGRQNQFLASLWALSEHASESVFPEEEVSKADPWGESAGNIVVIWYVRESFEVIHRFVG